MPENAGHTEGMMRAWVADAQPIMRELLSYHGWVVQLGIVLWTVCVPNASAWAQCQWAEGGGSALFGVDETISAMAVFDDGSGDALYVAGDFTVAGDVAASNIAKWNGSSWSALGSGTNANVYALAV